MEQKQRAAQKQADATGSTAVVSEDEEDIGPLDVLKLQVQQLHTMEMYLLQHF